MKSLKATVLKFWQEIVLVVPIGLFLIALTKWAIQSQSIEGWIVFLVIWFLPLFICLIGQFFWKNEALAAILSVLLGISSVIVTIMAFFAIFYSPSYITQHIPMFVVGVICVIAAFKMFTKYEIKKTHLLEA